MVTRKYREPKNYERGGAVLADVDIAGDGPTAPVPAHDDGGGALMDAVKATIHAEQLQREAEQIQREQRVSSSPTELSFEDRLSGMQVPENAKAWLRAHPELLEDASSNERLGVAHQAAIKLSRHEAFSPAYFSELERSLGLQSAQAGEGHQRTEPQPTTPRRSMPMTAPVSRDVPMPSGRPSAAADNTLSASEREIAAISFPHLSRTQAEYAYLQNRKKMHEMKADGRIQGDG